jgi:hypothetical protein
VHVDGAGTERRAGALHSLYRAAHERIARLERVIEEDGHPDASSFTTLKAASRARSASMTTSTGYLTIM